jgi:hypothetical protein
VAAGASCYKDDDRGRCDKRRFVSIGYSYDKQLYVTIAVRKATAAAAGSGGLVFVARQQTKAAVVANGDHGGDERCTLFVQTAWTAVMANGDHGRDEVASAVFVKGLQLEQPSELWAKMVLIPKSQAPPTSVGSSATPTV